MIPNEEREQKLIEEQLKKKEMRLNPGIPLPVNAAKTDRRMKYIQKHYFLYRTDESTKILTKGRKIKSTYES